MKASAYVVLFSILVCLALPLHAQDGASLDLGASGTGQITASDGSLTLSSGATVITASTFTLDGGGTLSLGSADSAELLFGASTFVSDPVYSRILASPSDLSAITVNTLNTVALTSTNLINPISGLNTAIVTGGTLTAATNLTLSNVSNSLAINSGANIALLTGPYQQLVFPYAGAVTLNTNQGLLLSALTASNVQANVSAGSSFTLMPAITDYAGLGTTVRVLGGSASVDRSLLTTFSSATPPGASDVVNFGGTISDTFVLELSYNQADALALPGGPGAMQLQWLNPNTGLWENAVDGNTGGTPTFVNGAYNPALDSSLGTYGVDTTNDVVWAVIDHNSTFTVDSQVPEPGGSALLICASVGLLAFGRFRRPEVVK